MVITMEMRMMRLMLYREAGGTGYDPAISKLAKVCPDFYHRLQQEIEGIKGTTKYSENLH